MPAELERIVQTIIDRVKLARRLHDVFRAIVLGWDIRKTGQELGLADNTVRLYRQHVFDAFGIRSARKLAAHVLLGR